MPEHVHFSYKVELGGWALGTAALQPEAELWSAEDACHFPKRTIVEYLQKVAPRNILFQYRLLGSIRKTLKNKTIQDP